MSTWLRGPTGVVEVWWWWEPPRAGRALAFRDPTYARAYVGNLCGLESNRAVLRRFVVDQAPSPLASTDDTALFDQLSRWLVAGTLRVASELREQHALPSLLEPDEERAPAPWLPAAPPPDEEAPPPEPDTLSAGIDGPAIARVLKEAAASGIPFCEECMKHKAPPGPPPAEPTFSADVDAAASAEALKRAARDGTPFCEQCAKARLARENKT